MIQRVYALFDSAALTFAQPIFVPAAGVVTRMISEEVNRDASDNPLFRHTSDFTLYFLGTYDTDTGVIQPSNPPELVHRCVDLKVPA